MVETSTNPPPRDVSPCGYYIKRLPQPSVAYGTVHRPSTKARSQNENSTWYGAMTAPAPEQVQRALDDIVAAMQSAGLWSNEPLPPGAEQFHEAFAADTMAFSQWLQFVFVSRVQSLVDRGGPFPNSSAVAVRAVREFDGQGFTELEARLRAFDALFVAS